MKNIVIDSNPLLAAVAANVLYGAAYAADLLAQFSDSRKEWLRYRWLLWVAGTAPAAGIFLFHG